MYFQQLCASLIQQFNEFSPCEIPAEFALLLTNTKTQYKFTTVQHRHKKFFLPTCHQN